jgi:hypothetical protein
MVLEFILIGQERRNGGRARKKERKGETKEREQEY